MFFAYLVKLALVYIVFYVLIGIINLFLRIIFAIANLIGAKIVVNLLIFIPPIIFSVMNAVAIAITTNNFVSINKLSNYLEYAILGFAFIIFVFYPTTTYYLRVYQKSQTSWDAARASGSLVGVGFAIISYIFFCLMPHVIRSIPGGLVFFSRVMGLSDYLFEFWITRLIAIPLCLLLLAPRLFEKNKTNST